MPCFLTLAPCSRPLVPGGTTKAAWPREPSSRSTDATTTCTLAMPPLVAHAFWPFRTHSSLASSYFAVRAQRGHVGARVGLGDAERADLHVVGRAVALRHPLHQLLGRAGGEDPRRRQRAAHDRHADPGVAPEQLLVRDRQREPARVGPELGQRLEAVEADLGRLLDDRPGRLLALVPLRGRRAHHALGEAVDPVADVALVVRELEREGRRVALAQLVRRPPRRLPRWRSFGDREHARDLGGEDEVAADLELAGGEEDRAVGVAGHELEEVDRARPRTSPAARCCGLVGDGRPCRP